MRVGIIQLHGVILLVGVVKVIFEIFDIRKVVEMRVLDVDLRVKTVGLNEGGTRVVPVTYAGRERRHAIIAFKLILPVFGVRRGEHAFFRSFRADKGKALCAEIRIACDLCLLFGGKFGVIFLDFLFQFVIDLFEGVEAHDLLGDLRGTDDVLFPRVKAGKI